MYKYTIIIPHKDILHLLKRCINSIPKRYDIQTIIVDDNSGYNVNEFDNSTEFNSPNIEIYLTKEGKGAGYARNIGLKHAKGEWIIFADADDIFLPDFNQILSIEHEKKIDIIYFGICSRDSDTNIGNNEANHYNEWITNSKEETINDIKYKITPPWGKVYRKKFLEKYNIKFEEVTYGNDVRFSSFCDYYAKNIKVIKQIGYCWMTRKNSLWHNKNIDWAKTRFNVAIRLSKFMKTHNVYNQMHRHDHEASMYLSHIEYFSKPTYIQYLLKYGIHLRSFKILFFQIPLTLLHYLRIALNIKISLLSTFTK